MSYRKVVPNFHQHGVPTIVLNPHHKTTTPIVNPPFQPKRPSLLATDLIKSYFNTGLIKQARKLFDEMSERDVVAWTAMISGYASCNYHTNAWMVFCDMLRESLDPPNAFTLSSVLKVCKGMKLLSCGALAHGLALKHGLDDSLYVENALLDMYATCSCNMYDACMVFQDIRMKNAVSWTTLSTGYAHRGDGYGALRVFREMLLERAETDPFSFSIAVRACTSIGFHTYGKQIHAAVLKHGFVSNIPVMNSILDMYCKCSLFREAHQCFHRMDQRDLVTWNILISGYEMAHPNESLQIFSQMELEGFCPNNFTYSSVIAACSNLAALGCGQQIHGGILKRGLEGNMALGNALIDMYAKCGSIMNSCRIFNQMSYRDLVSWTSMIIGYGSHGYGKDAVELFDKMLSLGIMPDRIVFMAVLGACSHAGLVDEGLSYFKSMIYDYKITPNQDIYGCVVDLLGRSGRIEEALELIESMPFEPDESVWGAFLAACRVHGLQNLSKWAAQRVLDLRPNMAGSYVMLSNIYAAEGNWGDFARMRKLMKGNGKKKESGRSWVEVKDQVCSFVAGDLVGPHFKSACEVIEIFVQHMKEVGCVPDIDYMMYDSENWT